MAFEIDKFYKEVEDLDTQKEEQHYEMVPLILLLLKIYKILVRNFRNTK